MLRLGETMGKLLDNAEEALRGEVAAHGQTLALLREIREGRIDINTVQINETGWEVIPHLGKEPDAAS